MSDATTTWLPIVISIVSLGVAASVAVLTEMRNRRIDAKQDAQADTLARLNHQQQLAELRLIIQRLIIKWRNSHLNDPYAVTDDNWRALLNRVKEWRTGLHEAQASMLAYTDADEGKTRPFFLLERTVKASKEFERVVEPIVERWDPRPEGADPYDDKLKVQDAIIKLQSEFHDVLDELEDVRGEDLVKPTRSRSD